jgi:hypothetical protein
MIDAVTALHRSVSALALAALGAAACARSTPAPRAPDVSVVAHEPGCLVTGEADLARLREVCRRTLPRNARTAHPSLRAELVPEPVVVPSGGRAHVTVRLTNLEPTPTQLVFNCPLHIRVVAPDRREPEADEADVCPASGLAVELAPQATLHIGQDLEAVEYVRVVGGDGWSDPSDPAEMPGAPLAPGVYSLAIDLPSITTRDAESLHLRGTVRVE